ncbi:hypothetical protein VNI00_009941 [Paramarasmius palmivorus]|uniref:Uncharacterized protein n=1 Tax=Paramarasmius palmivorus TaxID=297713 RepID=A0AAW0CN65_9AGAR
MNAEHDEYKNATGDKCLPAGKHSQTKTTTGPAMTNEEVVAMCATLETLNNAQKEVVADIIRRALDGKQAACTIHG